MGPSQQQRDQMMQRLTPEQRKQVEEMMKQHGAGAQPGGQ
jgi:Spy/CpxP family protein refolding chaperone